MPRAATCPLRSQKGYKRVDASAYTPTSFQNTLCNSNLDKMHIGPKGGHVYCRRGNRSRAYCKLNVPAQAIRAVEQLVEEVRSEPQGQRANAAADLVAAVVDERAPNVRAMAATADVVATVANAIATDRSAEAADKKAALAVARAAERALEIVAQQTSLVFQQAARRSDVEAAQNSTWFDIKDRSRRKINAYTRHAERERGADPYEFSLSRLLRATALREKECGGAGWCMYAALLSELRRVAPRTWSNVDADELYAILWKGVVLAKRNEASLSHGERLALKDVLGGTDRTSKAQISTAIQLLLAGKSKKTKHLIWGSDGLLRFAAYALNINIAVVVPFTTHVKVSCMSNDDRTSGSLLKFDDAVRFMSDPSVCKLKNVGGVHWIALAADDTTVNLVPKHTGSIRVLD